MTVKELIEALQCFPEDFVVRMDDEKDFNLTEIIDVLATEDGVCICNY